MSALITYLSKVWTSLSPAPTKRRSRRIANIDPDSIEPINHWFPGNRAKKQPRRLVETPTAGHWPEFRIAKSIVGKGRKRCAECGALVKEGLGAAAAGTGRVVKAGEKKKKKAGKAAPKKTGKGAAKSQKKTKAVGGRNLRGRVVEVDE